MWVVCWWSPMTRTAGQHAVQIQYMCAPLCTCVCMCARIRILNLAGPDAAHWPLWTPTQPQLLIDSKETVCLQEDTHTHKHKSRCHVSKRNIHTAHDLSANLSGFREIKYQHPSEYISLQSHHFRVETKNIIFDSKCHAAWLQSML